ncbi:hypothetical protein UCRPA7_4190 [Phaeoacremonium minimum UCRPA7]|uniref:Uncharacterized protein n=1 Tax=Phaeoacremonium minimum (strain UCR-PA7) TaxID=1286976 RepID=R8BLY2_PHAM7|nr:hypothetical protein UCRPA7_4190 [Phaeoacremonium minimum UCRPA7]EOO00295.1 hypothetical protein UCRPA7_4190 [Phaeoacremonium minimum UCRPA7]
MLSPSSTWASLGLALILCIQGSFGDVHPRQSPNVTEIETETTVIYDPSCSSDVTIIDKTTILSPTTVPVTHYVSVPVTHYVDVTYYVNITSTSTFVESITESTTTTLHYTVSTTETDLETVSFTETDLDTVSITETDLKTITNTETDLVTITNTETDSTTITETTYTTTTIFSTTYDPCPTTCSISAGTVNLYFWPTDRPYSYPTTYVDTNLGYTFVSPSVYMYIPTAVGTNSLGLVGPSTSKWMLPLDLFEVSTIVDGSITRQLTLSDLGTDCPQTADPTAIATMVDSRCDPILAAPKQVSSWAYPCNACGRFGLFDPPNPSPNNYSHPGSYTHS